MTNLFLKERVIKSIWVLLAIALPTYVLAAEDVYSSRLVNQSKHSGTEGYKLVKSKVWPSSGCIIESGKQILNPGESTELKIKKSKECNQSGIGYSIYKVDDTNDKHLIGYLSHRLGDGKFSVQISRFCEGSTCVFTSLNPEQNRKNVKKNK